MSDFKYHCSECGSEDVNIRAHVNPNTNEIHDIDWDDELWCENCNTEAVWECHVGVTLPGCPWPGHQEKENES